LKRFIEKEEPEKESDQSLLYKNGEGRRDGMIKMKKPKFVGVKTCRSKKGEDVPEIAETDADCCVFDGRAERGKSDEPRSLKRNRWREKEVWGDRGNLGNQGDGWKERENRYGGGRGKGDVDEEKERPR
jgi:hypothetical protein